MSTTAVRTGTASRSVVDALQSRLDAERLAVTAEMDAFDAFLDRLGSVDPGRPAPAGGVRAIGQRSDGAGLESVRSAYEDTVMSVTHYDEEYGDTYRESVVEEFGPEIGVALTEGPRLQPHLKRMVTEKAQQCRAERERFQEILDTEAESVESVGRGVREIRTELREFDPDPPSTQGFGALEAEWRRLDCLEEKIDQLATDRQRAIIRQRRSFTLPTAAPDVPTYLYREFDDEYPLLSVCVDLRERVRTRKSGRERKLAGG